VETLLDAGLSNAVTATFLALLVACLGWVLARRPAVLHCLWLLVLLKLVTPPLYEVAIPWPRPFAAIQEPAQSVNFVTVERMAGIVEHLTPVPEAIEETELPAEEIILEPTPVADRLAVPSPSRPAIGSLAAWLVAHGMTLVAMIWLAGTVAVLVLSAKRVRRFHRLLREARAAGEETQKWINELAIRLGLRRPPSVWWIGGKLSPLVWPPGLRARLIIPTDLWKSLDDRQRSTLIVHELAHLRRGDHRVRIFELIVTALFWWHPVLWWARQALRDVEEQCCDAWVVWAFPESAKAYAETLLETLDFLNQSDRPVPLLGSGFGKVHHLRKRLTMIMSGTTPRLLGVRGALVSLGIAVVLLPFNATWAQKPDQKMELRVNVKSDADSPKSADAAPRIEGDAPEINGAGIITVEDMDGKLRVVKIQKGKPEFQLEMKTDDSSVAVTADSTEPAIAKIKEQIRILRLARSQTEVMLRTKETPDQEKLKKSLQLLNQELESQVKKMAEIDMARAKVKELTRSLATKQEELARAQRKLAALASASPLDLVPVPTDSRGGAVEYRPGRYVVTRPVEKKQVAEVDQKRLDEIEKKLQQLLDEVASLKKDRAK